MLDADSQLFITDFGLARMESDAAVTMTGDLIGTLRYMSPEQALAKRVVIDQRSDIYSLGATLYELVALRPVFDGENRQELLKQIAFDEPAKLRSVDRSVPNELETIVHKALAKSPDERYSTAAALADDLRSFCQNRPIKAKPPTTLQRASKWAQRHQGLVAAALMALLVTTATLAGATWVVSQKQHETKAALADTQDHLEEAERQRQRADLNFRLAQETVDSYLTSVSEDKLLDVPGLQPLRKELLLLARDYYQTLANENGKDRVLQTTMAQALHRVSDIEYLLGNSESAATACRRALEIRKNLNQQGPGDADLQHELAESYLAVSLFSHLEEGHVAATADVDAAIELTKSLKQDEHRVTLAKAYARRGSLLLWSHEARGTQTLESSRSALNRAIEILAKVCAKQDVSDWRRELSETYQTLASWHEQMRQGDEMRAAYRESLAIDEQLAAERPDDLMLRARMAHHYWRAGAHEKCIETCQLLAKQNPTIAYYRELLADYLALLGVKRNDTKLIRESIEGWTRLAKDYPVSTAGPEDRGRRYLRRIGVAYQQLGLVRDKLGQVEDAVAAYNSSAELLEEHGDDVDDTAFLASVYAKLIEAHRKLGNSDEEFRVIKKTRGTILQVVAEAPRSLRWRNGAAYTLKELGLGYRHRGNQQKAIASFRQGIELLQAAPTDVQAPSATPSLWKRARALETELHGELGVTLYRDAQWREAVESLERAEELGPRDHDWRMYRAMAVWQLGNRRRAKQIFAEGAAWIAFEKPNSETHQEGLRQAASLMELTEEDRAQLVATFYSTADRHGDVAFSVQRGMWHQERGDEEQALADFLAANAGAPSDPYVAGSPRRYLIHSLLRMGRREDAARKVPPVGELSTSREFNQAGALLAHVGDEARYVDLCREMLARFAHSDVITDVERTCKVCSILPGQLDPASLPLGTLELTLEQIPTSDRRRFWFIISWAMVRYRLGDYVAVADRIRETLADESNGPPQARALAHSVLAMCEIKLAKRKSAIQNLATAEELISEHWTQMLRGELWTDWLNAETLRREAGAMVFDTL